MIAIVNVSAHENPTGLQRYELRINRQVITTFEHIREEGLATCLRKAADAAELADLEYRLAIEQMVLERFNPDRAG